MKYSTLDIYTILLRRLVRDHYPRENALPSERDIADEFGASRTVIRGILKRLEEEGYLEMVSPRKRRLSSNLPTSIFDPDSKMVGIVGASYSAPGPEEKLIVSQRRIRGVFNQLNALGLSTLNLSISWSPAMILDHLATYKICGLIYVNDNLPLPSDTENFIYRTLIGRLPIATFGDAERIENSATPGIERASSNHRAGPRILLKHLASCGIRRVLWYYPSRNRPVLKWQAERQAGYEMAALECEIELLPITEVLPITNEVGTYQNFVHHSRLIATTLSRYLSDDAHIDAIVVDSDVSVPYFQCALRELGIKPGESIPVAGYDNYFYLSKPFQWEATPPIATVDKCDLQIGEAVASTIMRQLQATDELTESFSESIEPRLVLPEQLQP